MNGKKLRRWVRGFIPAVVWVGAAVADEPVLPDDALFDEQWGLYNVGQVVGGVEGAPGADMRLPDAWGMHQGTSSVVVAIVGTGVDPHPEYADRLLEGCATVGDPYNSLDLGPTGPKGTHVAGLIAAATDNEAGIAGLNGAAKLLPIRVTDSTSPTEQSAATGIIWAVDHGADIVVVPLQFYGGTQELEDAVTHAVEKDVLVIAPTGGAGSPVVAYPARFPGCLAVAATTNTDEVADFSNYGPEVDLAAPGQHIVSTWRDGGYENLEAAWTSAAAHAAGVAALVLSYAPQLSAGDLKRILISSADDLGPRAWDDHYGAGRINAYQALQGTTAPALRFEEVEPLPDTILPNSPTTLSIRIASVAETVQPASATLFYRDSPGSFSSQLLTPVEDDVFTIEIPATPCEATLEYYLSATGDRGSIVTHPLDAPDSLYAAYAIDRRPLFGDDFEDDLGWETIVEDPGNTNGGWVRVIPVGTSAQPGFDYSPDAGAYCFVTGQNIPGQPGTHDVDGGPVRLLSPVISIGAPDAEVSYARWFHSSGESEPDELTVELSRDGGQSWTVIESVMPTDTWQSHRFRISQFPGVTGNELRIRFSVSDPPGHPSLTEAAIDEFHVIAIHCAPPKGDFDGDGHISLTDFGRLRDCLTGPETEYADNGCSTFDFEDDGDVDLIDAQAFQSLFNPP